MLNFNKFFQEITDGLKGESLLHVSRVTGISEPSLRRSFVDEETVPTLATFSKLMHFLDWELSIQQPSSQFEILGADLEDTIRKALLVAGPISRIQYPTLNTQHIRDFINGKKTLTTYNAFAIMKTLKLRVTFCKPVYKDLVELEYDFSD